MTGEYNRVGESLPLMTLLDLQGAETDLRNLQGGNWQLLVFLRHLG